MTTTFIGTGLIGAGLAEAALGRGETVRVYNRTREKTDPLARLGAEVADSLKSAAAGATRVHLALTSDDAVDAVLAELIDGATDAAVVIDHSTTSPAGAAARAERAAKASIPFLHAPVFMSPEACRAAKGMMLVAGPNDTYEAVRDGLAMMTGAVWYVGQDGSRAASLKLVGNSMILSIVAGLADAHTVAQSQGVAAAQVQELFERFDLGLVVRGRGARMARGDFETQWSLQMARKDLGLMLDCAGDAPLASLRAIDERMEALIAAGLSERDVGVLIRDALKET